MKKNITTLVRVGLCNEDTSTHIKRRELYFVNSVHLTRILSVTTCIFIFENLFLVSPILLAIKFLEKRKEKSDLKGICFVRINEPNEHC